MKNLLYFLLITFSALGYAQSVPQEIDYTQSSKQFPLVGGGNSFNGGGPRADGANKISQINTAVNNLNETTAAQARIQKISDEIRISMQANISTREKEKLADIQKFLKTQNVGDLPIYLTTPDIQVKIELGNIYSGLFSVTPKTPQQVDLKYAGIGLVRESDNAFASGDKIIGDTDKKLALVTLDLLLGINPVFGTVECIYETLTGWNPILNEKLLPWQRAMAFAGALTGGYAYRFAEGVQVFSRVLKLTSTSEEVIQAMTTTAVEAHSIVEDTMRGEDPQILAAILRSSSNLEKHHLFNRGPLYDVMLNGVNSVAETFRGGTYLSYTTTEPTILFRVFSKPDELGHLSSYWTRVPPTGPLRSIMENALEISYGNAATKWIQIEVPAGTQIFEGISSSSIRSDHKISDLVGSADQVYLHNIIVQKNWIKKIENF